MIEAKVMETSFSEIKYKYFDDLDGPVITIFRNDVISIIYDNGIFNTSVLSSMYKNGTYEIASTDIALRRKSVPAASSESTAVNPDKLIVGINANPGGLLMSGPSLSVEFSKGKFYSEINLIYPYGLYSQGNGFGGLVTFNYFHHTWNGGAYIGGGIGDIYSDQFNVFTFGLNGGYKFITKSGFSFRPGVYIGLALKNLALSFYFKPDLTVGFDF
jgi:hypothetical protein